MTVRRSVSVLLASLLGVLAWGVASAPVPARAEEARWTYGRHPVLGTGAYVELGGAAIAVVCGYSGPDLARDDVVSVRLTRDLLPVAAPEEIVTMFDSADRDHGPRLEWNPAGYVEGRGNSCETGFQDFRTGRALLLIPGRVAGVEMRGSGSVTRIRQNGAVHVIAGSADFAKLQDVVRIPLTGSGQAIAKLLKACPAIQRDMDSNCGSD